MNVPPVGIVTSYPNGLPAYLTPDVSTVFTVSLNPVGGTVTPGSPTLHYILPGGTETTSALSPLGGNLFQATLPPVPCTERIQWWVTSSISPGNIPFADPPGAPASTYVSLAALGTDITLRDEIEGDVTGWKVAAHASLTGGHWQAVDPIATVVPGTIAAPEDDATSGDATKCFVTQQGALGGAANASDVDFGPAMLTSPKLDLVGQDAFVSFAAWFYCDDVGVAGADTLDILVSGDDGVTLVPVMSIATTNSTWKAYSFRVSDYIEPTSQVRIRFQTSDPSNNSITEAGIDNFQVETILCPANCTGDFTADGSVDAADLGVLLGAWGSTGTPGLTGDLNNDGTVDGADLALLLGAWGACP